MITESPVPGKYALPGHWRVFNRKCRSSVYGLAKIKSDSLFPLKAIVYIRVGS